MDAFYVLPPKPASWRIDPTAFERAMKERWPLARITHVADPTDDAALRFELALGGPVSGELKRSGQVLVVDYMLELEDLSEVAIWFRDMVPPTEELMVASGPGDHVRIAPGMKGEELVQALR